MNETQTTQYSEFVFRRLSEPVKTFWGQDLNPIWWLIILGVVLAFALFYVVWMYTKDARGIGPYWAALLGFLRLSVYAILTLVFLLPAVQTGEDQVITPKVILLFDTSRSMQHTNDERPREGQKWEDVPFRQDKVLNLIDKENFGFLTALMESGSVSAYRFGNRLDESYFYFHNGLNFTRDELESWRKAGGNLADLPEASQTLWTKWEDRRRTLARNSGAEVSVPSPKLLPRDLWATWLKPEPKQEKGKEPVEIKEPAGLGEIDLKRWQTLRDYNKQCSLAGDFLGTNVADAVLAALEREKNNLIQGIVVFSDGKNTVLNTETIETLVERAKGSKVPVFFVGVGADRPTVRIDITNVRLPRTVRPDDAFKGVVEVVGIGLPDKEQNVFVDVSHVRITRKKVEVEVEVDGMKRKEVREKIEEEVLPLALIERDEKKAEKDLVKILLTPENGGKITLPVMKGKFDKSPIPKFDAEFAINPQVLADAAGIKLDDAKYLGKKWELQATETDPAGLRYSEIRFTARTPKHDDEMVNIVEHVAKPVGVAVIKKKLNVLVFASSASREYQFMRSMWSREVEKERAEFSIYLQNPPGVTTRREGILQDIDQDRFLNFLPYRRNQEPSAEELAFWLPAANKRLDRMKKRWKETAGAGEAEPSWPKPEELARLIAGFYDLGNYDVIIALDPDWGRIADEPRAEDAVRKEGGKLDVPDLATRLKTIQQWVDNGGGLVVVGGAINTIELARPRKSGSTDNVYKPIQELYPVVLQDIRVREVDNKAEVPYPLNLDQAPPEMEFMRLKESNDGLFLTDWKEFFGEDKESPSGVKRGFYWYYPSERVREGALVVARYTHPGALMKDGKQQPFLVVSDPASGRRVVWLASAEMWRLRTFHEAYHERFWTKLARFAAAGSQAKSSKRITLIMAPSFKANNYAEIEAKIETLDGRPLKVDPKLEPGNLPQVIVSLPQGLPAQASITPIKLLPKTGAEGWFSGKFLVRYPGPGYRMELQVPRTGDTDTRSFDVEESNPETDDTRPDFPTMYQMASEATEVLDRIKDTEVRNKVRLALSRPRPVKAGEDKVDPTAAEKLKLFFEMGNASLIPGCMTMKPEERRVRGRIKDQWDEGFTLWTPKDKPNEPVKISYVLLLIVGLLSAEWLIRKLLRLA